MHKCGWTRCWRGRWKWGTPLSTDASKTSKDAAVFTEDEVNTGRTPCIPRRNIQIHIELGRTKETTDKEEGEEGGEQEGPASTWGWGSWSWGSLPKCFYETSSTEERQNIQNMHICVSLHRASETETFLKLHRRPRDLTGQGKTWILNAREHVCSPECGLSCFSLNHLPFFTFIP